MWALSNQERDVSHISIPLIPSYLTLVPNRFVDDYFLMDSSIVI